MKYATETLLDFSQTQETFINDAAAKARLYLSLNPSFDLERWFDKLRIENPLCRGVSMREFGAAVLGTPFTNS